ESEPRQEEIDVVSETNDVLPPRDDDSDDEVDVDGDLRVDNIFQNFEHEYLESEDSDIDNPLLPLPPLEPPDKEFEFEIDFEKEISVERNLIVKFECIDARIKFDVENDVFKLITFSLISAESEDTIFDPENGSQSTEHINDNSSNPLSDESTIKNDYFDDFYGPFISINILEEEITRREHADYINGMEMLFTINPHPHNPTNDNTNVESISSFQIPNQESEPRQEEIDVFSETNDVLPPSDDDSDDEVDVGYLRVDNVIQNSKHEYSENEDSPKLYFF
nr:hypothetical protein [Tanacetum cinerariifolium]